MVNYVKVTNRKTFQNKIFPELNSKKHTPSPTVWFLIWVSQKRNRAILREMTFANDCANCCFFAQNWYAKKETFCVSFRKNCAKVLQMETLSWTVSDPIHVCNQRTLKRTVLLPVFIIPFFSGLLTSSVRYIFELTQHE